MDTENDISFGELVSLLVRKILRSCIRVVAIKRPFPRWNVKHVRGVTGVSLCLNVVVFFFLCNSYLPSTSELRTDLSVLKRSTRLFYFRSDESANCHKTIAFFGMREHWLVFCSFPEFAHYKYLITFPREVQCPTLNCSVSVNYTLEAKEIQGYDIVVFTNVYEWLTPQMWDWAHGNRTEGQRWVMITEESPLYVPGVVPPAKYGNNTYDWFDSYKSDSDFVHPYGFYQPFGDDRPPEIDVHKYMDGKTKLVAWMGSHCETLHWSRKRFVDEFQQLVHVDKYGKCGDIEVPWNNDQAILDVLGKYKFYLSLENSCCDDYVTEKFWRALEMGLVPIVVGAPYEHYVKFGPPNSFIHADQFDSMTQLAVYLIELNANDEKYLEYFKWRNLGKLVNFGQEEQYVRPLNNETQCALLEKYINTDPSYQKRLDYFGPTWEGSCTQCGQKPWINTYMLPKDYERDNTDIWA